MKRKKSLIRTGLHQHGPGGPLRHLFSSIHGFQRGLELGLLRSQSEERSTSTPSNQQLNYGNSLRTLNTSSRKVSEQYQGGITQHPKPTRKPTKTRKTTRKTNPHTEAREHRGGSTPHTRQPPRGKGAAAAPRDRKLAERQGRVALLPLGSHERRTSGLRLLPPGPGQVRPTNVPAPPYEGAGCQPPAPRGELSTEREASYHPASPAHPRVADPPVKPF
jgi:hypothetical protein